MQIRFQYSTFGKLLELAFARNLSIPAVVSDIVDDYFRRKEQEIKSDQRRRPNNGDKTFHP